MTPLLESVRLGCKACMSILLIEQNTYITLGIVSVGSVTSDYFLW